MSKIKAVTIHAGHNPKGKIACGASDYIDESTEARLIVKKVKALLKKNGIKVFDCTVNNGTNQKDVLNKICAKCNSKTRDVDISIHFNSSVHQPKKDDKTTGTEVLVKSMAGVRGELGNRICLKLAKLGFQNRGVKVRDDLYFLNHTAKPAILVEVCFVSDPDDAILYKTQKNDVAKSIVQAILDYNEFQS